MVGNAEKNNKIFLTRMEREEREYNKAKQRFENSPFILEENKKLMDIFIHRAIEEARNELEGWGYNRVRYSIMKKICEDFLPNMILTTKEENNTVYNFSYSKNYPFLTKEILSRLSYDLRFNNLCKKDGSPYRAKYKEKFSKVFSEFLKYTIRTEKYIKLIKSEYGNKNILKVNRKMTEIDKKQQPLISKEEIEELIEKTKYKHMAFFYAVMFDGFFRPAELEELTYGDIDKSKSSKGDLLYTFRFKRTKNGDPKTTSLFMFSNIVEDYLGYLEKDVYSRSLKFNDRIFTYLSQTINNQIKNDVKKILKREDYKNFNRYTFRHAGANYFADKIAIRDKEIYDRGGWKFGSKEARVYIQTFNAKAKDLEENYRKSILRENKEELDEFKNEFEDKLKEKDNEIKELKSQVEQIYQLLERETSINVASNLAPKISINDFPLIKMSFENLLNSNPKLREELKVKDSINFENFEEDLKHLVKHLNFVHDFEIIEDSLINDIKETRDGSKLKFNVKEIVLKEKYKSFSDDFKSKIFPTFKDFRNYMFESAALNGVIRYKTEKKIQRDLEKLDK